MERGTEKVLEQAFPDTQGGLPIGLGHLNITTDLLHALRKGWAEREKALVQGQSAGMSGCLPTEECGKRSALAKDSLPWGPCKALLTC